MLTGYRLGGRIVIPRAELDDYRPMAVASKAIEPLPSLEEVIGAMRARRRRFIWPVEPEEKQN